MTLISAGALFVLMLVSGVVTSLRADRSLPSIDVFSSGSQAYIKSLLARNDYAGAIEQLQMQARMLPYDSETREELGNLLSSQSRLEEARTYYEQLVDLRPDYAEGYYYVGCTYLDSGQPVLASQWFKEAIRRKPDFPIAINNLGVALARRGQLQEAILCFNEALRLNPEYAEAQDNLNTAQKQLESLRTIPAHPSANLSPVQRNSRLAS